MDAQLCKVCKGMFTGEQIIREPRPHYQNKDDILAAADDGCRLCKLITKSPGFEHIESSGLLEAEWYLSPLQDGETEDGPTWFRLTIDAMGDEGDPTIDTGYDTSEIPEGCQDVDEKGNVRVPKSGAEVKGPERPEFPPAWAFTLIPATAVSTKDSEYEPPAGTQSPQMWSLAKGWLDRCQKDHPLCRESRNPTFCPTRLVEIVDSKTVRVIESSITNPSGPYAAFSHCWGRAKTLKLLEENKRTLETSIEITELPQSYKEALDVASRFGIKYIWIDSLCIIQNNVDDWRAEAATMKDVYNNALLTIAASAAAENSEASFLQRDPLIIQHLRVTPKWDGIPDVPYLIASMDAYNEQVESSPLRRRSWVLQESFLSARTLSLSSSQLWWECREALFCEAWPNGVPDRIRVRGPEEIEANPQTSVYHERWCRLVEKYTKCGLTVLSDKMVAIGGLAGYFQPRFQDDEYVAGLWRSQLPQALCWVTTPVGLSPKIYRPSQYRASSWSWASIEGPVYFYHLTHDAEGSGTVKVCQVLDVQTVRVAPLNPTGDLKGGYIKLKGRLFPVNVREAFLTVPDQDSNFNYIKGSSEDKNRVIDDGDDRTWVVMDEQTTDEWLVISHLDTSGVVTLKDVAFDTATRVTNFAHEWEGGLFGLPIIEWIYLERPRVAGIILGHAKGEPADRYQRVGFFHCDGEVTCSYFKGGDSQEFFIV